MCSKVPNWAASYIPQFLIQLVLPRQHIWQLHCTFVTQWERQRTWHSTHTVGKTTSHEKGQPAKVRPQIANYMQPPPNNATYLLGIPQLLCVNATPHSYAASLVPSKGLHNRKALEVPESAQEGISPGMMISLRAGVVTIYSTLQLRLWVYTLFPMLPSPQKCICICSCWYHADNPCKLFSSVVPNKKVWLNIRQRCYCWGLIYCATQINGFCNNNAFYLSRSI